MFIVTEYAALNATGLEPTSFDVLKILGYPLGYRGIVINFIQISNCTTILSAHFTKIHGSLNIHVSRVNFDKQYKLLLFVFILRLFVYILLLFVYILQLFVYTLQLFVYILQLFVYTLHLFVYILQLFVYILLLFVNI